MALAICAFAVTGIVMTTGTASANILAPSYIPSVDIYPTATFVTGDDVQRAPGGLAVQNGDIKFNASIDQPLLKNLTFHYEYDRASGIDNAIGNITNQLGQVVIGGASNDIVNDFHLAYSTPQIGIQAGYYYRYRFCCPNTAQAGNATPADWHASYLQAGYTTPKFAALGGATLGVTARGTYNHHHVSAQGVANEAAFGYKDFDGKAQFGVNYGANVNIPLNHGFSLFGSYSFGAFDFFDNAPTPFYYDISDFGFNKTINKYLAFTADINNLVQQNLSNGDPFIYPNTIHRVYLATALHIHLGP